MRLSEVYTSVQGEGPRAGTPTQFVRFAGCNLKCPLWPCDTPHAIDPRIFEKEQVTHTPQSLLDSLPAWPHNLCLTGGEPFIQKAEELEEFVHLAQVKGYHVECFSNGTLRYPQWALRGIDFVMDWKLPGSGEDHMNKNRLVNAVLLKPTDYIKFVIADEEDYCVAQEIYEDMKEDVQATWSYGVAWGKMENKELIDWVLKDEMPWQLNIQLHNFVWPRDQRGI